MRFIPEAAFALLLAGAGFGQSATVGKSSSCNAANEALLKSQVTHASDFCEFYLAAGRTRSPLVGVNAADTIKACQCLLAASNIHTVKKPGPTRYSSSQRYVCNKQALATLQQDFAHPQNLCTFFTSYWRDESPSPNLSTLQVEQACACYAQHSTSSKHTSTSSRKSSTASARKSSTSAKHTSTSTAKKSSSSLSKKTSSSSVKKSSSSTVKKTSTLSTRKTSVIPSKSSLLSSAKTVISSLPKVSSSQSTKLSTLKGKQATTSSLTSSKKSSTSSSKVASITSSARASTSSIVSSSNSSSASSTAPYKARVSTLANGTEYLATGVTLAAAPTATLLPYVPPGLNMQDLSLVKAANISNLYYASGSNSTNVSATVAQVSLNLQHSSVNLDISSYISSVTCNSANTVMTVKFNSAAAFSTSKTSWQAAGNVILISSSASCSSNGQSIMFLATSVSFGSANTATASGRVVRVADVYQNIDVNFGTIVYDTANATATSTDPDFDLALDAQLGFHTNSTDADDIAQVFSQIAPGISLSDAKMLFSRGLWNDLKSVGRAIEHGAEKLYTAATSVAKEAYSDVTSVVKAAATEITKIVNNLEQLADDIASGKVSKTLDIGLDFGPPEDELTDSPWGDQYLIYKWTPSEKEESKKIKRSLWDSIAKAGAAAQAAAEAAAEAQEAQSSEKGEEGDDEEDGEGDNDEYEDLQGIEMFCVNCGVQGEFKLQGALGVSLKSGLTTAAVSVKGDMDIGMYLGLYAHAQYERTWETEILSIPLSPITIPEIFTLGPEIIIGVSLDFTAEATGQVLVGGDLSWPSIAASMNFLNRGKSYANGFKPSLQHSFEANGTVDLTAALGFPVSLAIGLDVLDGEFAEYAALTDTPAIELDISFTADITDDNGSTTTSINGGDGCYGFDWSLGLVNQVEFDIKDLYTTTIYSTAGPTLASGCLGHSVTPTAAATSTAAAAAATTTSAEPAAETTPSAPECPLEGLNVLANGGFEDGNMDSWSTRTYGAWPGPSFIGVVSNGYYSSYAFEMQNGAASTSILEQTVSGLVPGVEYTFSYNWQSNENQPSSIECASSDGAMWQESIAGQLANDQVGQWQDASTTFTASSESFTLSCYVGGAAGQNFYMDTIYIGC